MTCTAVTTSDAAATNSSAIRWLADLCTRSDVPTLNASKGDNNAYCSTVMPSGGLRP